MEDAPLGGARLASAPPRRLTRRYALRDLEPARARPSLSFNCHAGLQARRNGVCEPYDLDAVLRGFDADVIVVQESWTPRRRRRAAVRRVAERARRRRCSSCRSAGPSSNPGRTCRATATGNGTVGPRRSSAGIPAEARGRLVGRHRRRRPDARARRRCTSELDVDGTTVDLVGVHLTSRLPYGPPDPAAPPAPRSSPPRQPSRDRRRRLQLLGPGRAGVPARLAAHRARAHLARRAGPTARSTTSSCDRRRYRGTRARGAPAVGSDHRPVRATLRVRMP